MAKNLTLRKFFKKLWNQSHCKQSMFIMIIDVVSDIMFVWVDLLHNIYNETPAESNNNLTHGVVTSCIHSKDHCSGTFGA